MVPTIGLEPTRPFGQQLLRLPRLPLRHVGIDYYLYGAEGGTRTLTPLRATVFETAVSAIPPPRQVGSYGIITITLPYFSSSWGLFLKLVCSCWLRIPNN